MENRGTCPTRGDISTQSGRKVAHTMRHAHQNSFFCSPGGFGSGFLTRDLAFLSSVGVAS